MEPTKPVNILLATPCYDGMTHARYTGSLAQTVFEFKGLHNIDLQLKFMMSEANLPRARNVFAATLLSQPSFTHLLFIDSDISFHPKDILRLLQHQKPVVAASYPKKKLHWGRVNRALLEQLAKVEDESILPMLLQSHISDYAHSGLKKPDETTPKGLVEVDFAPTGFMLIERGVFERIVELYPELKISFDEPTHAKLSPHAYCFFDLPFEEGKYLSEDYSFCRRWRQTGGKVYIDFNISLGHHGQHTFYGNPFDMAYTLSKNQQSK